MIQDIGPKTYRNEYFAKEPDEKGIVLVYRKDEVLLRRKEDGSVEFPRRADFDGNEMQYTYLFAISEEEFYLGELLDGSLPEAFHFEHRRLFRLARPRELAFAGITGHQLYEWYHRHLYCGACGVRMQKDRKERMVKCPSCGNTVYPVISPAVIIAVTHRGKLLMSKYAGGEYRKFALIAGFNEIGETIEETVHREVMEEVGLKVKNLVYYKSQPWPFTGTLLMGFFCELDGDDERITLQEEELSEAGWYPPEEVPEDEEHIALTREMMTVFKNGTFPVPAQASRRSGQDGKCLENS
jgi:NAD+ diphosphatase